MNNLSLNANMHIGTIAPPELKSLLEGLWLCCKREARETTVRLKTKKRQREREIKKGKRRRKGERWNVGWTNKHFELKGKNEAKGKEVQMFCSV